MSVAPIKVLHPLSEQELAAALREAGLDPTSYGTGSAKSLSGLLAEIKHGECSLQRLGLGRVERLVEPVFVQLRWRGCVLVEIEQRFNDGRRRQRNMLLAEKRSAEDADASVTALRGMAEELELDLDLEAVQPLVRVDRDLYTCVTERSESTSYPGLQCVYHSHHCVLHLSEAGEAHFQRCGLLQEIFETSEYDKVNVWQWMPLDIAKELKVKGFPAPSTQGRRLVN